MGQLTFVLLLEYSDINTVLRFKMNQKVLVLAALVCLFAVPALGTFGIVIGGLTLTAAQVTVLGAGLLGAKLLGIGIGAKLASRGRSRGYSRKRHGRDVSGNEINELEYLFHSFEVSDPAHCFRRYICDLATGQMNEKISHQAIKNLFLSFDYSKSATFEYEVAFKFGQKLRSIQECEATYDCPLSGQQLDKLFE